MRMLISAIVLAVLPIAAAAEGCNKDQRANMSCADGQVWDETSASCIVQTS